MLPIPGPWGPAQPGDNPTVAVDHYENFPVASLLCPPALRPAIAAIYWFARTADDLADEGDHEPAHRLEQLAAFRADLNRVLLRQEASLLWPRVFEPLAKAHARHKLPVQLLHDLLDAFEQDVRNPPYADREALLGYCRRSANPVGRLLLHLYGLDGPHDLRQSDNICTALQLINFWQDLGRDLQQGRNYLPAQDLAKHGLSADVAGLRARPLLMRDTVRALCDWAGDLMRQGAPLALRVPGRAGWELRLVVQGGLRILEKIARLDHDTLHHRPTLSRADAPLLLWRAARMTADRIA
jgi:hydroxysqualene synthase